MTGISENINSIKEMQSYLKSYKEISQISENKIVFYITLFSKTVEPISVFDFVSKKYSNNILLRFDVVEETASKKLVKLHIEKLRNNSEGKIERIKGNALCLFDKTKHLALFLSDGKSNFLREALPYFLNKLYPFSKNLFISSTQIRDILEGIKNEGYFISATLLSIKRWWQKEERVVRKGRLYSSEIHYLSDVPIEKVLKNIGEENSFINTISFDVRDSENKRLILRTQISRKGLVKYVDGYYDFFEERILNKIIQDRFDKLELFENKERTIDKVNEIKVEFDINIPGITNHQVVKNFSSILQSNKNILVNLYHSGNPYFHSRATDYNDGSTYDILFYDKNSESNSSYEMMIIPQYSCSGVSLSKLISYLFSRFGEGKIQSG